MTPRQATFAVFATNGAMIGTWVAHIPWLQERLDISKTTIGFALLCMAVGALIAMPLTGQVLARRSSASVTRAGTLVYCLMLPLPLIAPSPVALGAILFVFGAANGVMDVSMNAHGVAVERDLGKPIMSSLHGGWSVGGFLAAGLAGAGRGRRSGPARCWRWASASRCGWRRGGSPPGSARPPPIPRARAAASRCPPAA